MTARTIAAPPAGRPLHAPQPTPGRASPRTPVEAPR